MSTKNKKQYMCKWWPKPWWFSYAFSALLCRRRWTKISMSRSRLYVEPLQPVFELASATLSFLHVTVRIKTGFLSLAVFFRPITTTRRTATTTFEFVDESSRVTYQSQVPWYKINKNIFLLFSYFLFSFWVWGSLKSRELLYGQT
jgi:hypothetical protein